MGKSGARKKKGGSNQSSGNNINNNNNNNNDSTTPKANGGVDLDSSIFLKRAHELKEEGNKRFQSKDFAGALEQYENALRLTPKTHPDRAVFHSNRAACMMQMRPINYDAVVAECTMALQVQPRFVRALLRRARAYEAVGRPDLAMLDIRALLAADPNNCDALDIAQRLRAASAVGPRQEAQQDLQSRPSPAALGASAVRGAPIGGLGPCLPARPLQQKKPGAGVGKAEKGSQAVAAAGDNGSEQNAAHFPKLVLKPASGEAKLSSVEEEVPPASSELLPARRQVSKAIVRWRQLKLVYDHDIRLAQMPLNCSFRVLRETVAKRFPSSKSVLIKYKDNDGDLVTVTSTGELRFAESCVDGVVAKDPGADETGSIGMLRLHIVEVSPEQEPPLPEEEEEEEEEEDKPVENEEKGDENGSNSSLGGEPLLEEAADSEVEKTDKVAPKEKPGAATTEDPECKELEMDDWLFEFAQLFRTHVGIDPDAHIDLHELGMELCSEALEETVTSEDAQSLFDKAASKFQEVAALAFFNWGNVHMCAARKRIPLDENAGKEIVAAQLQTAYDWVRDKYALAREKYEEALAIKPDFYEGLLALGQQQFEMAKLHWSYTLAKKMDLAAWDSSETLSLFDSAEEKMRVATKMWERLEEQRASEAKDPSAVKRDELSKRRKKQGSGNEGENEVPADESAEQAAVMRSQIHLFWGNMLFERSQVECKLGTGDWKKNLDAAVERFKLAGASETDISTVLKNHCSKGEETPNSVDD